MPARPVRNGGAPGRIVHGEALEVLRTLPDGCAGLVYADPPFNTGAARDRIATRVRASANGTRRGFAGRTYESAVEREPGYADRFDDYIAWLRPRLVESRRILAAHGTLYLHVDPRESHYCKVLLDEIFGRDCFLNEVIWAYDFGGRSARRWAAKHDVILVYVRDTREYTFNTDQIDRVPYMAPQLQTPERAARGKLPTDVWWNTIVPTASRERTGYPTQKPTAILRRIVAASSRPGDLVVDWCAGSGTTGAAAAELGRRYLLIDESRDAVAVMRARLPAATAEFGEPGHERAAGGQHAE
ncbi:MAG: site-specific DNA-methyltransferase [Candidatus Dormibacteraeota bacterium]|nr:site-specific DNA-methyltransferase [Candidatus Dormibacteraeota bacterium]